MIIKVIVFIIIVTMAPIIIIITVPIFITIIIVTMATIKANPHSSYLSSSKLDLNWRKLFIIIIIIVIDPITSMENLG